MITQCVSDLAGYDIVNVVIKRLGSVIINGSFSVKDVHKGHIHCGHKNLKSDVVIRESQNTFFVTTMKELKIIL